MEPVMHQVWPRVLQRLRRTLILSKRNHSGCAEHTAVPASTHSRHIRPTLLVSRIYQPTSLRDVGQESRLQGEMTCKSQRLMQQAGLIHPSNPGCYYYLPATVRSMEKLVRVIDQEMHGIGGQKLDMPSLCSADLWKTSEHCPQCKTGTLVESRGIEVGHTFYLGKKYSQVFNATFSNVQNKPSVAEMGCYGLGVTRILAAAIEVMSTEKGIRWPGLLAPYQVCVLPPKKGSKMDEVAVLADNLVHTLGETLPGLRGEVVLDDRTQMTIGKRLKDASRLGYPYVIVVGQGALEETPRFEVICQQTGETMFLGQDGLLDLLGRVETV
ncbi:probable proline--tRNA ligase, mitochondrial [Seriola lalandi dorsalis]|uniref:probable proline--tRNA ligase, mitochondrial n=1 Tax=Seriola lalandi dorsalis TaxID=1841481 RepID=UPI000C6F936E|nr:probable proline--tRNA ligase, mitochondrial [Seriola lalandi dorsalis]